MNIQPLVLIGAHVRLEPLAPEHIDDLFAAAQFPEIWEYFLMPPPSTREQMRAWIETAQAQSKAGTQIWLAIIRRADNRAVGVTSYMNIARKDRGVEIGGTWLTPEVWHTPINTECKYLLRSVSSSTEY